MNTATAVTIAALAALTPTVTTLIGIILARQDVRDLRTDMRSDKAALRSELRTELRSEFGSLRAAMNALRKEIHADLLLIHERVATVEANNRQYMVAVDGIEPSTYGL